MKKFMAMLLALVRALSLVACGQKADDTAKDDANTDNTDDSLVVLENVVDWGETEPYRVLVQKGDPKGLLEGINKAIAELTANDGALIKEIEDKVASQDTYMPDAVSSDLAAETTDDTAASDKPVLVMGTSPDYPPYEFFADAAMTEYAGIDVEVAKYIAESMGMTLQIESMNFDNLVTSLSNGDFDVVLAACEYTEERAKACDFSDPYYTDLPPVILVKAANADKYKTVDEGHGRRGYVPRSCQRHGSGVSGPHPGHRAEKRHHRPAGAGWQCGPELRGLISLSPIANVQGGRLARLRVLKNF